MAVGSWALICGNRLVGVVRGSRPRVKGKSDTSARGMLHSPSSQLQLQCSTERSKAILKSRLERALNDSNSRPAEPSRHGLYRQLEATRTSRELSKVEYEEL